jgi:hypothetical protein
VALFSIGIIISVYQGILETVGEQMKNKWSAPKGGDLI